MLPKIIRLARNLRKLSVRIAPGKCAQIKMFETMAVLVVFFFLLALSAVFYINTQRSVIEDDKLRYGDNLALQVALRALYFPELDCSFMF